jgi:GDP-D-mannose dehydratase
LSQDEKELTPFFPRFPYLVEKWCQFYFRRNKQAEKWEPVPWKEAKGY